MTRQARSGNWRGRANQGSREGRRSRRQGRARATLDGEVRWIDREQDVIHVLVEDADGPASPLVGKVVEIGYARPSLRLRISDRDRNGRLEGDDMALGDRVRASGCRVLDAGEETGAARVEARRIEAV